MKQGILLAGGLGTRLGPITASMNKHFLPIYDKPLIYYPLSTMILAGVQKLVLISTPESMDAYRNLLGDGSEFGIDITYVPQLHPEGIPQAITLAENHLNSELGIFLALGDNVIYGPGTGRDMSLYNSLDSAQIFCYSVSNPEKFGVIELDEDGNTIEIVEKPSQPKSNLAIVGFYKFPKSVFSYVQDLKKSARNEYEIVDLIKRYNEESRLRVNVLPRGSAWLDAGTTEGFIESSQFVRALQNRQGLLVGSPHEAAWRVGNISRENLGAISVKFGSSDYGILLNSTLRNER
jgi:glucose-1-phosphate thymidylyltransferase